MSQKTDITDRYDSLREAVLQANLYLNRSGVVMLSWGNVSGVDRRLGVMAIKPSGVPYEELTPEHIVVLDMTGDVVEGCLKPSSDTPTHLALYKAFPDIGGVAHTHSPFATMFAQARAEIPCLGTTHADVFCGPVPLTRTLQPAEVERDYEANTGIAIAERFAELSPSVYPGVLVAKHGPFTWGPSAMAAAQHSVALEAIARMAWGTLQLRPDASPLPDYLLAKHHDRKHGPNAYYGQTPSA
jgi:L-ribulose-5-phosphate 4-epimerase